MVKLFSALWSNVDGSAPIAVHDRDQVLTTRSETIECQQTNRKQNRTCAVRNRSSYTLSAHWLRYSQRRSASRRAPIPGRIERQAQWDVGNRRFFLQLELKPIRWNGSPGHSIVSDTPRSGRFLDPSGQSSTSFTERDTLIWTPSILVKYWGTKHLNLQHEFDQKFCTSQNTSGHGSQQWF